MLAAGEASPEIEGRARQELTELEFVRRIEEIRAESGTAWGSSKPSEASFYQHTVRSDQDYAAAFREAGIEIDMLPVKEAAKRITAHGQIAAAVLPALDDWVAVRSKVQR